MEDPMSTASNPRRSRGQTLAELGIVMPFVLILLLGIFQVSFLIYQQYDAINLAREAANITLRDEEHQLDPAVTAISVAQFTPNFDTDVKLILSVVKHPAPGELDGPNANKEIIVQRHVAGTLAGTSVLGDPPSSSYGPGPKYSATDMAFDATIQARTPLPNGLVLNPGQSVFVAEIYLKR